MVVVEVDVVVDILVTVEVVRVVVVVLLIEDVEVLVVEVVFTDEVVLPAIVTVLGAIGALALGCGGMPNSLEALTG